MEKIIESNVSERYKNQMGIYAIEVTRRRMVPDWRDGLKLVQRRILVAMLKDNCVSKYVKTAKVVGTTMGDYHPHGDSSIADAIKHMTNWFEYKMPLIDNQSNFGSMQGDGAAAPRYTEVKLSPYAIDCMLSEIMETKEVTDWVPTFDNTGREPEYLTAKLPNLLINGSFSIAIGFTVGIPKHALNDVVDATIKLIRNPDAPVVLIPDQCMACDIIDTNWKSISNKGKGKFKVRARIDIEKHKECYWLIIKSTPDMVFFDKGDDGGEKYKIIDMVKSGQIPQITDIVEETVKDKSEMRIIVKLRKGSDPNFVKEMLYKATNLETTFTVNFEVLDGIKLVPMSYKSYLQAFIMQRMDTKFRQYCIRHQVARTRSHSLEAYIKALESGQIDDILKLIRKRTVIDDNALTEELIKRLKITDIQAKFIIEAPAKKLSMAYLNKYKEDYALSLEKEKHFLNMIKNEDLIKEEIIQELEDAKKKYNQKRCCRVISKSEASGIPEGNFKVIITEKNYIKKIHENEVVTSYKGDSPAYVLNVSNTEDILLFSEFGKVFKLPVHKIPITEKNSTGIDLRILVKGMMGNIVKMMYEPDLVQLAKSSKDKYFLTVLTAGNCIKKMDLEDFMNVSLSGLLYTRLNDGDRVVTVDVANASSELVIHSNKKALRISLESVPHYKRSTYGVIAMNTKDPIDGFCVLHGKDEPYILTVTESGKVNKIPAEALPKSDRNKAGNNIIKLTKGDVIKSVYVTDDSKVLNIDASESHIEVNVGDLPLTSSVSTGQKVLPARSGIVLKTSI